MDESNVNDVTPESAAPAIEETAPVVPAEPAPPITSRFLFVDVSAMRAKQLRRGARPRLSAEEPMPRKAERIAMQEVKRGLVYYEVPEPKPAGAPR